MYTTGCFHDFWLVIFELGASCIQNQDDLATQFKIKTKESPSHPVSLNETRRNQGGQSIFPFGHWEVTGRQRPTLAAPCLNMFKQLT